MKNCPKCNAQLNDDAMFCVNCGAQIGANPNPQQNAYAQPVPTATVVSSTDHTAEFSPAEVADNKLFAALIYALSIVGVVIALLANLNNKSEYLKFHIKQGLKLFITDLIVSFCTLVLCWTCIVPIAGAVCAIILLVVEIICFIQVLRNKSVEPPIISGLGFLK
ncbi:MAG TPA: hypothetical protein DD413_03875 [Ruminococcus sp.]|nr:hypothetical protein [Ruminococcus sp.]